MSRLWESVPNKRVFFHVENKITSLDEDISAALQYFSVLLSVTCTIKLLLLDIALGLNAMSCAALNKTITLSFLKINLWKRKTIHINSFLTKKIIYTY